MAYICITSKRNLALLLVEKRGLLVLLSERCLGTKSEERAQPTDKFI